MGFAFLPQLWVRAEIGQRLSATPAGQTADRCRQHCHSASKVATLQTRTPEALRVADLIAHNTHYTAYPLDPLTIFFLQLRI